MSAFPRPKGFLISGSFRNFLMKWWRASHSWRTVAWFSVQLAEFRSAQAKWGIVHYFHSQSFLDFLGLRLGRLWFGRLRLANRTHTKTQRKYTKHSENALGASTTTNGVKYSISLVALMSRRPEMTVVWRTDHDSFGLWPLCAVAAFERRTTRFCDAVTQSPASNAEGEA